MEWSISPQQLDVHTEQQSMTKKWKYIKITEIFHIIRTSKDSIMFLMQWNTVEFV